VTAHYRNDNPKGITAPNPAGEKNKVAHITKHRGMKTPYTSVSEDQKCIQHFEGVTYQTDDQAIISDKHNFISHPDLLGELQALARTSKRADKIVASRAYMLAQRAREALIDWQFDVGSIDRKKRIAFCYHNIQRYFQRV
jgi:hypothetical protein